MFETFKICCIPAVTYAHTCRYPFSMKSLPHITRWVLWFSWSIFDVHRNRFTEYFLFVWYLKHFNFLFLTATLPRPNIFIPPPPSDEGPPMPPRIPPNFRKTSNFATQTLEKESRTSDSGFESREVDFQPQFLAQTPSGCIFIPAGMVTQSCYFLLKTKIRKLKIIFYRICKWIISINYLWRVWLSYAILINVIVIIATYSYHCHSSSSSSSSSSV